MPLSRRTFLGSSSAAAAAVSLPFSPSFGTRRGTADELRVGVIGIRSRGRAHIGGFHKLDGARVVAVADADRSFLDREKKAFETRGEKLAVYQDYRRLLDAKDVDVIAVATPNHWHSLMAIQACQAGKDVYLEKPISHNVWEGRKVVEAARKYGRIVASGTQSRSNRGMQSAVEFVQSGKLGRIERVVGLCYKPRGSIGKVKGAQDIPASVDYDLWCGPADNGPLRRKSLHYDWHWVWATGNGDLGNQGIHQMDIGRWILGESKLAPRTYSVGGRLGYDDDGETANTHVVVHDYAAAPLIFEVRGLREAKGAKKMDKYRGASIGVIVECESGHLSIPSYSGGVAYDDKGKEVARFKGGGNHFQNCVDAIRSRRHEDLNADIEEGHISSALCHVGNVAHRLGRELPMSVVQKHLNGRAALEEPLGRMAQHMKANELGADTRVSFGPVLTVDPETEQPLDLAAAMPLWKGTYRKGFEVPEEV